MLFGELGECFAVGMVLENQPRRGVVGARRHADLDALGSALGLVLEARRLNRVGAGADETKASLFDRTDELFVLRHEAIARENVIVAVDLRDLDDLLDALRALFFASAGVVRNRVNARRVQASKLWG